MKCQKCGNELRPNSRFCHTCGTPVESENANRGRNNMRVAFVFIGVIPALIVFGEFVFALITNRFSPLMLVDLVFIVTTLTFFAMVYRGYEWATIPIGLIVIISSLVKIIFLIKTYSLSISFFFGVFGSILYIVFGIYLIKSRDVLAFIKNRAMRAG